MMHDYGFIGGGHMYGVGFQMIIVLLFFGIALWMLRGDRGYGSSNYRVSSGETAEEILKKKYVTGQITKAEFDKMKKDIGA